jgi:prophage regulatory protein
MTTVRAEPLHFMKVKEIAAMTRLGVSTIYRMVDEGRFPRPRRLSPNCVRWIASDVEAWMLSLPSYDGCA